MNSLHASALLFAIGVWLSLVSGCIDSPRYERIVLVVGIIFTTPLILRLWLLAFAG